MYFSVISLLVLIELFAVVLNKHDFQMMKPFGLSCSSKTIFRLLIGQTVHTNEDKKKLNLHSVADTANLGRRNYIKNLCDASTYISYTAYKVLLHVTLTLRSYFHNLLHSLSSWLHQRSKRVIYQHNEESSKAGGRTYCIVTASLMGGRSIL